MTSKTIFNMNTKLKKAAMKKAREEGWTLSAILNLATQAYVDNRIGLATLDPAITQSLEDFRQGRYVTHEELKRKMTDQRKSR
jgi:hypothetical protein